MLTATQSLNLLRWLRRVMVVILIIVNLVAVTLVGAAPAQQDTQPQFPIRAAFYYPWFPEAWNQQGFNPFTKIVNGYLRFNVQGVNAPIASARLRIFANSSSSTGIKVFGVSNNTWVENTITYNNAPTLGSQAGSSGGFAGGAWITIDITSLITGNGVFNMAITGLNATAISLASREAGANAPQLIITTR